ncbi:Divalent manganese/zinc ABC transporter [Planctomycetales bacterium 10988]|nr:Divalent manganese/zinc ABC transporter [Planctomycetales bacterium 10988]
MNEWIYLTFAEPLTHVYFQKALLGGSLIAAVCGVIGCFVILRRMAFLGDALSHAMLAGISSGYLFMQLVFGIRAHAGSMLIGAVIAAVVTVGLVGFVSRVSRLKEDTSIGIMYTGVFAAGGVLVSLFADQIHIDLLHFFMGNVLAVADTDLWVAAIVCSSVLSLILLFFRPLQLTTFDPLMAASIGIPIVAVDYLLTICTSFVVVSGVSMVGVVLVVGLLITPAASAYLLCDRLSRMLVLAGVFGVTSVLGGLYLAQWINVAGGSAIVLFCTVQFLGVLAVAPRYGLLAEWLRIRNRVPQQTVEKVLRALLREQEQSIHVTAQQVQELVDAPGEEVRKALKQMHKKELVETEEQNVRLTAEGLHEARRILRAHRLWETYLDHVGMPSNELHSHAEILQHVHDEDAVDYLDSKLGHPLYDPHGSEIPEDFVHLVPGNEVKLSLLREGYWATVQHLPELLEVQPLQIGMRFRVGPRQENPPQWTLQLSEEQEIVLDRKQADAIRVRVEESDQSTPAPSSEKES